MPLWLFRISTYTYFLRNYDLPQPTVPPKEKLREHSVILQVPLLLSPPYSSPSFFSPHPLLLLLSPPSPHSLISFFFTPLLLPWPFLFFSLILFLFHWFRSHSLSVTLSLSTASSYTFLFCFSYILKIWQVKLKIESPAHVFLGKTISK